MKNTAVKKEYFRLLFGSVIIAAVCGCVGGLFSYALKYANFYFGKYDWLLYFLPLGGILTVLLYKVCGLQKQDIHTVLRSVQKGEKISALLAPDVFVGTVFTQLFGGSAGKEGSAIQIGGGIASPIAKFLGLKNDNFIVLSLCGMTAMFSAVFTLPLTALAFGLEIIYISRKFYFKSVLPLGISSFGSFALARLFGVNSERFEIGTLPEFSAATFFKSVVVIICCAVACVIFCISLDGTVILFKRLFKNDYVRIIVGGIVIIVLTFIVNNNDYNGGGMHIIEYVLSGGQTVVWAFALKILFTAVTNASGFKGGEIVPALFIGATLGSAVGNSVGIPTVFAAALGMVTLFGGATKCMVAALFLGLELFGFLPSGYFALAIVIAQIVTSNIGIFNKKAKNGCIL